MPSLDVLGVSELDFPTSYKWALSLFGGPSRGVELTSQMSAREKVLWHRAQSFGSGHTWSGEGGRGHPPNQPDQPNQPRQMPPQITLTSESTDPSPSYIRLWIFQPYLSRLYCQQCQGRYSILYIHSTFINSISAHHFWKGLPLLCPPFWAFLTSFWIFIFSDDPSKKSIKKYPKS